MLYAYATVRKGGHLQVLEAWGPVHNLQKKARRRRQRGE